MAKRNELIVTVQYIADGNYITAYCPALEFSSFGKTIKEARAAIEEALDILIEELDARGTLEQDLLEHGWTLQQKPVFNYKPPKNPKGKLSKKYEVLKTETVSVPLRRKATKRATAYASQNKGL